MYNSVRKIAFAGSGNVAWHLAKAFRSQGFVITGIWSRQYTHAEDLARECATKAFTELSDLCTDTDILIIAVPDKAIEEIAGSICNFEGIVLHTAGSVGIDILKKCNCSRFGVLYPLQTFSKEFRINMEDVPFFLESSSPEVMNEIKHIALKLSTHVYEADSHQRLLLHIAAVFSGNYANLMYVIANEILKQSNLPPEVLHSLITETARKAVAADPLKVQTGPARRHDTGTIEKHIGALAVLPEYAELYRQLARMISKNY